MSINPERPETTIPDLGQINAEIDDALVTATENAKESHAEAPNSFGAGYDEGYRDGLRRALDIMRSFTHG